MSIFLQGIINICTIRFLFLLKFHLHASHSVSLPSLVLRRSLRLLFLNEPVAVPAVLRRRRNGLLWGAGILFAFSFSTFWASSPWIVTVDLLLPSDSLSGSYRTKLILRSAMKLIYIYVKYFITHFKMGYLRYNARSIIFYIQGVR